jgi:hypothetical protein
MSDLEKALRKIHTPESAMAELEYLEYNERQGVKVCQYEKRAFANIAQGGGWNKT